MDEDVVREKAGEYLKDPSKEKPADLSSGLESYNNNYNITNQR